MSIADKLQDFNDGLLDAYDAVEAKEGTVPAHKNLANLPNAIDSISGGGISEVESVTITNKADFQNLSFSGTYLTVALAVTVLPATAPQITQVVVSDPNMIHVLDNGNGTHSLHILKGGNCTVTVKDYSGTITDSMNVTINQALTDIAFTRASIDLTTGVSQQLHVIFTPSTATNQTLTWSSDNANIVVDQNGVVTANGTGHATISAYSAELAKIITCGIEVAYNPDTTDWADVKAHPENYGKGSLLPSKLTYNNTEYTFNWRVVDADYDVTLPDGTTAKATIIMMDKSLPFTNKFSTEQRTACDMTTEPVALADTYYYGYSGSTYTKLNVETGDSLPYGDYTAIYKTGLNMTKGFTALNNAYINRWDGSEIRAILNSDADNVKNAYQPVHITDRVNYTGKGLLAMLPSDMVAVIGRIKNTTVNNNNCFDGDTYETDDLIWLPAAYQMNFLPSGYDSRPVAKNALEGEPFQYYKDEIGAATNNAAPSRAIVQMGQSNPNTYWLRSCYYSGATTELSGNSDGSLTNNGANGANRFAAACAIIH